MGVLSQYFSKEKVHDSYVQACLFHVLSLIDHDSKML